MKIFRIEYLAMKSICSRAPSPRSTREDLTSERQKTSADTPGSLSPSSDERPRSRTMSHTSRPQSQPSRSGERKYALFRLQQLLKFLLI